MSAQHPVHLHCYEFSLSIKENTKLCDAAQAAGKTVEQFMDDAIQTAITYQMGVEVNLIGVIKCLHNGLAKYRQPAIYVLLQSPQPLWMVGRCIVIHGLLCVPPVSMTSVVVWE